MASAAWNRACLHSPASSPRPVDPWTVPVEIDADGNPTMADPMNPNTFQQSMNNYHSAKMGFFSEATGEMHEVVFGGISLKYLDPTTQVLRTDPALPFVVISPPSSSTTMATTHSIIWAFFPISAIRWAAGCEWAQRRIPAG